MDKVWNNMGVTNTAVSSLIFFHPNFQAEILFNGSANAIRRQALPQFDEVFAGRDQRKLRLLDIGCGTGRFLDSLKQVWPRLSTLGLDMSEPYVKYARRHLKRRARINLTIANAESLPVPDESQDAVTSFFCSTSCHRRMPLNPAAWQDLRDRGFERISKLSRGRQAALDYPSAPEFFSALRRRQGFAAKALEVTLPSGLRTGEVIGARCEK
jgi:SAM-dependent methyltransferase